MTYEIKLTENDYMADQGDFRQNADNADVCIWVGVYRSGQSWWLCGLPVLVGAEATKILGYNGLYRTELRHAVAKRMCFDIEQRPSAPWALELRAAEEADDMTLFGEILARVATERAAAV